MNIILDKGTVHCPDIQSHKLELLKSQLQEKSLYIINLWNFKILITVT